MQISKLTPEDGRAIQTLETILKTASMSGIKPVDCAAVASAVAWFSSTLMKQYGAVWQAENKSDEKATVAATPAPEPAPPPADAPLKVKAYNPGKVK